MAAVLLLLTCPEAFPGKVRVAAAGDPNVINYIDIHVEAFSDTRYWEPYMGEIGDVTLDMPSLTLKNVRFDLTTLNFEYDVVLDSPIIMKSSNKDWYSDYWRTRFVSISTSFSSPTKSATVNYREWLVNEFPATQTYNTLSLSGPPTSQVSVPWDRELPTKLDIVVWARDSHWYHTPMNGWANAAQRYFYDVPLIINSAPSLTVTTPSEQQLINEPGFSGMNIEGYVRDVDNNDVVVSAEIPNVFYKKVTIPQALYNKPFSIPIDVLADGIPPGRHTITVKVVDPYNFKDERTLYVNVSYRLRNKSFILINTPVDITTSYTDYEGDPKYQDRYRYDHDPNFFDNSMGIIGDSGLWRNSQYQSFPYSGVYVATFQARDNPKSDDRFDDYRLWSRDNLSSMTFHVHRKPIALFSAKLTGDGSKSQIAPTILIILRRITRA